MFVCASHTPKIWAYTVSYRTQHDTCSDELVENATKGEKGMREGEKGRQAVLTHRVKISIVDFTD
jgi:hypothetical protein